MKLSHLAFALPLAFTGAAAFADASSVSQFEHQTDAGKFEVTPGFTFGSIKTKYSSASSVSSATDSMFGFSVAGEYGINDMLSVGLKLGYSSDSTSFSSSTAMNNGSASGMSDPVLYLNGKNDLGGSMLRWGALLDFSLGNFTLSSNGKSENEYSGGITFTPFVGWEMANVGPGTIGARLSYDLYQSDRNFTNNALSTSEKIKGGNNLTLVAFYEMNFEPVIWGVDLGIVNHSAIKLTSPGNVNNWNDGMTNFTISTYAAWTVAPDITILPTIGYAPMGNAEILALQADANSEGGLYGTVAARFGF